MAAYMDYQSCRYSSWCPDRYDADEWYEAMDQQYSIDTSSIKSGSSTTATASSYLANGGGVPASTMQTSFHSNYYCYKPASTTITSSRGRTSTMMPLNAAANTMMTVCEDQPSIASVRNCFNCVAAAASVPRDLMPVISATSGDTSPAEAGDTSERANVAPRMMMMMPPAAADEEAAKLSSPFDWRELEASCRKLDAANIRITELDITCLGSPTTSDSAFDADADGAFGTSGDDSGGGGSENRSHVQVRYGITCEPADTSSMSVRPAIYGGGGATSCDVGMMARQTHASQPRHPMHVYGFPPVHHKLPPTAVHHMPLPSAVHVRRAQEVNTVNDRRHIHVHSAATNTSKGGNDRSQGNGATNASSGNGSFARPRSASTIAALSSILGGSSTGLEGGGGSGVFSLQPSSGYSTTGSGSDSDPVSGWRFGPSPSRGAPTTSIVVPPGNDDTLDLAVLPESGSSDKAASSDSSDSVPVSCGSSSNSSSNATDTNSTAGIADEAGMENKGNTKAAGTSKPAVQETSPDANSKVSDGKYSSTMANTSSTTNGTTSGSGGRSLSRVMRAFADRCQRAFTITPGRGRALRMTAAVQHRRCNSNERLDQLHIAMT